MSNWRRHKNTNNINNQRFTTKTQSSKPPLANINKHSVPAWEKDFCAVIGSVPWSQVVEAKRFMYLYDRVVQWDDSAGEDAFKIAKSRFWAEINGFPCDLPLPDPDVYIDDIDWDAEVDAELILDLERGPDPVIAEEEREHVVILDALVIDGQYSGGVGWGTGWGDAEGVNEEIVGAVKPESSWDGQRCDGWNEDSWGFEEKTASWDHNNNNNNNVLRTETWGHKKSNNNNRFNHKKVRNWSGKEQGREWRTREVPRGERTEDCRWRNERGRSRGRFQQYPNTTNGWTESF
ncbi:unnamed protein product [Cochlearia groenlandica]